MTAIKITRFGGISPKVPPRYLDIGQAQVAINCPAFNGPLQPLDGLGPTLLTLEKQGDIKTIYRYGQDLDSDTQYWFHWTQDVDVCRSQVAGDTEEWTFLTTDTPDAKLQATYSSIALSGTNYPFDTINLGVPGPASAPGVTTGAPVGSDSVPESRVYIYTWVYKQGTFEFESEPSPPSETISVYPGYGVTVDGFETNPGDGYNRTHRRIYRSVDGVYLYVGEIAASATSFLDSKDASELGEEVPSFNWSLPPDGLRGLVNLPGGIMAGFVGRDVYFCYPYHPHAWPEDYINTIDYPVVGLGRMDTTLAVLTKGTPYFIQGSHPDSMVVVKSDIEQACVAKRSIVSINGAVIYASPDGLIALSPGGSRILTENMFTRDQWQSSFNPESIHAYQHDSKYIAFYKLTNGTAGGFIFDLTSGQLVTHDIYQECGYNDLRLDKLFTCSDTRAVSEWGAGSPTSFNWLSKIFSLPSPGGFFSAAQVEAESYPITCNIYADGVLALATSVTSDSPFRLPPVTGRDWTINLSGSSEVFSLSLGQSMSEVENA